MLGASGEHLNSEIGSGTLEASGLFPDADFARRTELALCTALAQARLRVARGPVRPPRAAQAFPDLVGYRFDKQRKLKDVLAWTIERMESGMVHAAHPRYFGLFNPTPSLASRCADQLVGSFNPQLASGVTSPFPVAVEAHVIRDVGIRAGLPEGCGGHFTQGGSEANLTGLLCALTKAEPGYASHGARAFAGQPTIYVSREAHLAWLKAAHQTGIGRAAVVFLPTDGKGRISLPALAEAVDADISAGRVPVMIAATAGSTGAGMIDPLIGCGRIAGAHGIWLHVDAAWAGALLASDRLKDRLEGLELAQSVTLDAHKWLATSMGCGMFLVAEPGILGAVFGAAMSCMPSQEVANDPYMTTAQWSRRFIGLRLFIALASVGWEGYARHVENAVMRSEQIRDRLVACGWSCVNEPGCAVLCMTPPGKVSPREIARRVVESGDAWVSAVVFEGREVVRICVTSGTTTDRDVDILTDSLTTMDTADI